MSGFVIESEEELAAGGGSGDGQFKLLPEDQYVARVESIEVVHGQTSRFNPQPHDEWKVRFDILSFSDGSNLVYDDDSLPDPSREVRLTTYFDPSKRGMVPQPSKTRKFVTAALGVNVGDRIEIDDIQELIGKRLIVTIVHKTDGKNVVRDRLTDFVKLRKTRGSAATEEAPATKPAPAPKASKTDAEVEAEAAAQLARANDVFGEDLKF